MRGANRRRIAEPAAEHYGGVISRALLRQVGISARDVQAEVAAGHWAVHGRQTVAVHRRGLTDREQWWRSLWETGAAVSALDGVTALLAAGLRGFEEAPVHVSVLYSHRVPRTSGVRVHKLRRRLADELQPTGIPRVRPAIAALRAAHWAASDRQAATILLMTVQQGLCNAAQLAAASEARGRARRAFIEGVVLEICDGARALGEWDFAVLCRRYRLPAPERQVLRVGPRGRIYLDVYWSCGLVVEIDGVHHHAGLTPIADMLRQNDVMLGGDLVLRVPSLGLRLAEAEFMGQIALALASLAAAA